jgi:hypothetical protein
MALPIRPGLLARGLLAVLGIVFAGVGLYLRTTDEPERARDRGLALRLETADRLEHQKTGTVVLLEGRVAASNPASYREFVAYERELYDGKETSGSHAGRERWRRAERVAPPMVVETSTGAVQITNSGYPLQNLPHSWRSSLRDGGLTAPEGERVVGLAAGDRVTLEVRITADIRGAWSSNPPVEALVLFGGDHAAYVARLHEGVLATKILGFVFLGVGGVLLALVGWLWRRDSRAIKRVRS